MDKSTDVKMWSLPEVKTECSKWQCTSFHIRRRELKNAVDELRKQLSRPTKKASTISVLKAAQDEIQVHYNINCQIGVCDYTLEGGGGFVL
jgi:hypothetical protein